MFSFVNLWELSNHTLFDEISLPDGINKEILVNSIFDVVAEYEPLTIDVNVMKFYINNFFLKYYDNFKRLYSYTQLEYNPIYNYDKTSTNTTEESGGDSHTRNINSTDQNTNTNSGSDKYSRDGSIKEINSDLSTIKVSSFNSNDFQPSEQNENSDNMTHTDAINDVTIYGKKESSTNSHTDDIDDKKTYGKITTITDRTFGNIGVTTSTQMLEQDTNYWKENNMYVTIANLFSSEMCIMIL